MLRSSLSTGAQLIPLLLGLACGGRTGLVSGPPEADGGLDADGPDAATLRVTCSAYPTSVLVGDRVELEGLVEGEATIARVGWSVDERPPGAVAAPSPSEHPVSNVRPDQPGRWSLRFSATDTDGVVASCDVSIQVEDEPLLVTCPRSPLRTRVDHPLEIDASELAAGTTYAWGVVEAPSGALVELEPRDAARTRFTSNTTGHHAIELIASSGERRERCEVAIEVDAVLMASCSPEAVTVLVGTPIVMRASASMESGIVSTGWRLARAPAASTTDVAPSLGYSTTLTPDVAGTYEVVFELRAGDGARATCSVAILAVLPPPLMCPRRVQTIPLQPVRVTATIRGELDTVVWSLGEVPEGSAAAPPEPANTLVTSFVPDVAGRYQLLAEVVFRDGSLDQCMVEVVAVASGLRAELSWDSVSDIDIHLLNGEADHWFGDDDCYYRNCIEIPLVWYSPSPNDDPRIDLDVRQIDGGFGPETLRIPTPHATTYRLGAHALIWGGNATLRVFCGSPSSEPRATLGPVFIEGGADAEGFWRAADIRIGADGSCDVTPLFDDEGGPWTTHSIVVRRER